MHPGQKGSKVMKAKHGLGYKVWNQLRLAKHVDGFFQIYDELTNPPSGRHWPLATSIAIDRIKMALFQAMIVHLDMINGSRGVSLCALIEQAGTENRIDEYVANSLASRIRSKSSILHNVKMQRNNIIAHRSEALTFREVKERHSVTDQDLRELVNMYFEVTFELHKHVPFSRPWERDNERAGIKQIMDAAMKLDY